MVKRQYTRKHYRMFSQYGGDFVSSEDLPGMDIIITMRKDGSSLNTVIGKSVGYGGQKRAYKITDDLVLLLPSSGIDTKSTFEF
jgi:hypothetical protein